MLANLDVLIGLSVVMLGLSLVVTVIGQMVATALNLRGTNLRWGLAVLIQQLHPSQFQPPGSDSRRLSASAKSLVEDVLSHPFISDSKVPYIKRWELASAVRFDEFIKLIVLLGSRAAANADIKWLAENNRLTEPWFNSMMDRVSQRFTMHMRIYTVVISAALVGVIGVDTLHILAMLRNDATLRSGLVSAAQDLVKGGAPTAAENQGQNGGGGSAQDALTPQQQVQNFQKSVLALLPKDQSVGGLLSMTWPPTFPPGWLSSPSRWPGILLSMVLLSLGAPFWFNMLKNLTALRPVVAQKQERERAQAGSPPDVGDGISWKDL